MFPMELGTNRGQTAERIYPQVCMALLSLYCTLYTFLNYKLFLRHRYLSSFFVYFLFLWIYAFLPSMMEVPITGRFIYIMKNTIALSIMFCLYLSTLKSEKSNKYIYRLFYICVIFGFYNLHRDMHYFASIYSETVDSNSGFILASCLPMSFLIPNKRLRVYVYVSVFVATILSGQRAAFVGAVVTIPFAYRFIKNNLRGIDYIVFVLAFVLIALPFIVNAIENQIARHYADMQYEERYGGGRLIFWAFIINDFLDSNILQVLFGHLNDSVPALLNEKLGCDIDAHNGWLQNLYTYGVLGLVLYLRCYIKMYRENKVVNVSLPEFRNVFLLMLLMFFVRSTSSHGNFDIAYIPFCLVMSIIMSNIERKKSFK